MNSCPVDSLGILDPSRYGSLLLGQTAGLGKWVFIGALVAVLIWLIMMPRELIGQAKVVPPWWRNVRFWAIVVCLLQILVYWQFA